MIIRLGLGFATVLLLAGPALASYPGRALTVSGQCGDDMNVSIARDAALAGAVVVEGATGGIASAGDAVHVAAACGDVTTVRVPPDFPVTIDAGGSGTVHLGNLDGPVSASLRGDLALDAGRLGGPVTLTIVGGGDAHVAALTGPAVLTLPGSSDVSVGEVDTPDFAVTMAGSGDVSVGGGRIGRLKATITGSGDLKMTATVAGGEVFSAGSGDVSIARVTGSLVEVRTGSGDIDVHARGSGPDSDVSASVADAGAKAGQIGRGSGWGRLIILSLIALATFFWLRRRHGRSRAASPASMVGGGDPAIAAVTERLAAVSRRVGRLETLVTSRDFELERRFRELGD